MNLWIIRKSELEDELAFWERMAKEPSQFTRSEINGEIKRISQMIVQCNEAILARGGSVDEELHRR